MITILLCRILVRMEIVDMVMSADRPINMIRLQKNGFRQMNYVGIIQRNFI